MKGNQTPMSNYNKVKTPMGMYDQVNTSVRNSPVMNTPVSIKGDFKMAFVKDTSTMIKSPVSVMSPASTI